MRTIVYIDGQNFLYKAAEVLIDAQRITEKQELHTFAFRRLFTELLSQEDVEIRFYGTKLRRYKSPEVIATKSQKMVDSQRRLRNCLQSQHVLFIESGKLKLRDGDKCKQCGGQDQHFQEKGVDVKIAVDMINDAYEHDVEKLILYVGFSDKLTKAIVTNATQTQIIRDAEIIKAYDLLVEPQLGV